jgi:FkbM family methyltransferase
MKHRMVFALLALYERLYRSGLLSRPRARRAFEWAYLGYKSVLEAGPVARLRPLVPAGSAVVDVGANIGFFSLKFARWVGPAGRVIAIEPEAVNARTLRLRVERARLKDVVNVVEAAASDSPGFVPFVRNPLHPGDHHIGPGGKPLRAVTLDELTAGEAQRVSLVKVDVQGAEMMVLAGAGRLLAEQRPALFMEIDDEGLAEFGSSARDLLAKLTALGYTGHRLTRGGIGPGETVAELEALTAAGYLDVLFLPAQG